MRKLFDYGWMAVLICVIALFFIACDMAYPQIPSPQINLTGNIGCQGFPCLNTGTLNLAVDGNHTMTAQETSAFSFKVTSSVSLTATRNLVMPTGTFPLGCIENSTTGGHIIQIIGPSGTGVSIPNGASVCGIWNDGTNYVTGSVAGGSVDSVSATGTQGVTVSVGTPTTTPALTIGLGAITPTSVTQSSLTSGDVVAAGSGGLLTNGPAINTLCLSSGTNCPGGITVPNTTNVLLGNGSGGINDSGIASSNVALLGSNNVYTGTNVFGANTSVSTLTAGIVASGSGGLLQNATQAQLFSLFGISGTPSAGTVLIATSPTAFTWGSQDPFVNLQFSGELLGTPTSNALFEGPVVISNATQSNPVLTVRTNTVAGSIANVSSPLGEFIGSIWNGTFGVDDIYSITNIVGTGANPRTNLLIQHVSGTSGLTAVVIPALSFTQNGPIFIGPTGNAARLVTSSQSGSTSNDLATWDGSGNLVDSNTNINTLCLSSGTNCPAIPTVASTTNLLAGNGSGSAVSSGLAASNVDLLNTAQTITAAKNFSAGISTTTLEVPTNIVNAEGIQVASGSGCTTGSVALGACTATITISPAEPDTSYKIVGCSITGNTGGDVALGQSGTMTTTSFQTRLISTGLSSLGGTVTCLVIHN